MSTISNRVKRFSYLILGCFLCCLPAFATLFTTDFFTFASPLPGSVREAEKAGSVRGTASRAGTPPEAINVRNFYLQSIPAELFQLLPLIAKDSDGTITGFRIVTRPANTYGKLYVNSTAINSDNYTLSLAEAKQLRFEPAANNINQNVTFTFTAIDNENLSDASPATFTIPITTNSANLVCSGTGLGSNILGAAGTFSAPYITPNPTVNCINNNSTVASPTGNLGNRKDAQTTYTYASTSGSLGPEGTYSFLKTLGTMATRNCIKTDWVASDHTGDGGYAMIVNGSPNSTTFGKTFYQATSIPVCPNTLYEFSAYVINVLPGNHNAAQPGTEPNISFYINGQLVSTSGPIAYAGAAVNYVPQWVKVGGLWFSGPNTTSVELKIDNATFVAGGNDLGLDDISMAICGPDISYPDVDLTAKFCSYGVLPLKADIKASINTYSAYIFQNSTDGGLTWTDLGPAKTGSPVYNSALNTYEYQAVYGDIPIDPSMDGYQYRLKVATDVNNLTGTNCNVSADKVITVSTFNLPNAGADITGCNSATTAKLVAAAAGETWSVLAGNPAGTTIDQSGNVSGMTVNGIYQFQLSNTAGCSDIVSITRDEVKSAGADVTVCSPATTLKLADAGAGYKWEIVAGNPSAATIDASTGNIAGMTADGVYHFTLRSDYGGCADEILITRASIALTYNKTEVLCFGELTGSIDLSVSGGTGPYIYNWSNGQSSQDLNNIGAGTYTVTVTDSKGCVVSLPITISQPAELALSTSQTDVLCFGGSTGSINLSVSGGTAPYTYSWTGGSTTEDLSNLVSGSYTVTVTDANKCSTSATLMIAQPLAPLALISTKSDVLCFGAASGTIDLNVTGGTAPYTYSWQGGITTEDRTGLSAGTYNVTVTDAKGCQQVAATTITEPAAITASITGTSINCNGASSGSADLSVNGGTAPYAFLWSNGKTTEDVTGLAAGTHTVVVTDANGCKAAASVTITQPAAGLALNPTKTDVLCYGASNGSINLSVIGGTAPYTYSWTGGATTKDLSGLAPGTYDVTVNDANNCTVTASVIIAQPAAALEVKATKTNVLCFGSSTGAISLNVQGGKAPYTYKWNTGQSAKDLTSIPVGKYEVLITDAGNCSVRANVEISQPEPLKAVLIAKNQVCGSSGGSISSQITGGTKPYKVSWAGNSAITTGEIASAKAGIYEMIVTDAVGCTFSIKTEIRQEICAPVAPDHKYETEQDKVLVGDISPKETDSQPEELTYTKLTEPGNGKITLEPNGSFRFVPDPGFVGDVEVTYRLCNTSGQCDTAKVYIKVRPTTTVNLTPELSSVLEGKKVSVTARLTHTFKEDVTITVAYSGKAEKERDYLVLDQYMSLKIPKGSLSTTEKITIAALNDGFQEGDEDVILKIKSVSNPDVIIGKGAVVIINDVYPPPLPTDVPQDLPVNADIVPDALMSPNGDGSGNEFFTIKNIELYPDNEVLIFNRWGNELFSIKNYNNNDRNFKGFANKGILVNSDQPLSDGVYFYIISTYRSVATARNKHINKGYIILKR